jgi:hypothetical protein
VLGRQVEMIEGLAGGDFSPLSSSLLSYQIKTTVCNLSPRPKSIAGRTSTAALSASLA